MEACGDNAELLKQVEQQQEATDHAQSHDQIAGRLQNTRFLAVIGASGSGKSSLLRAGVSPRMRQRNWLIKVMTPTSRPLQRLATSLTVDDPSLTAADEMGAALVDNPRALLLATNKLAIQANAGHILLVVDQFEELFTLCRDETERQLFVDSLLTAVEGEGAVTILIGLRADFYDRCADYEGLRELVSQQQEFIGPMRQEDLVRVIAEPAKRGGWQFVDGLVEQILAQGFVSAEVVFENRDKLRQRHGLPAIDEFPDGQQ